MEGANLLAIMAGQYQSTPSTYPAKGRQSHPYMHLGVTQEVIRSLGSALLYLCGLGKVTQPSTNSVSQICVRYSYAPPLHSARFRLKVGLGKKQQNHFNLCSDRHPVQILDVPPGLQGHDCREKRAGQ